MYVYLTRYKEAKAAILLYPSNDISEHKHDYLQSWYLEDDKEKKIYQNKVLQLLA